MTSSSQAESPLSRMQSSGTGAGERSIMNSPTQTTPIRKQTPGGRGSLLRGQQNGSVSTTGSHSQTLLRASPAALDRIVQSEKSQQNTPVKVTPSRATPQEKHKRRMELRKLQQIPSVRRPSAPLNANSTYAHTPASPGHEILDADLCDLRELEFRVDGIGPDGKPKKYPFHLQLEQGEVLRAREMLERQLEEQHFDSDGSLKLPDVLIPKQPDDDVLREAFAALWLHAHRLIKRNKRLETDHEKIGHQLDDYLMVDAASTGSEDLRNEEIKIRTTQQFMRQKQVLEQLQAEHEKTLEELSQRTAELEMAQKTIRPEIRESISKSVASSTRSSRSGPSADEKYQKLLREHEAAHDEIHFYTEKIHRLEKKLAQLGQFLRQRQQQVNHELSKEIDELKVEYERVKSQRAALMRLVQEHANHDETTVRTQDAIQKNIQLYFEHERVENYKMMKKDREEEEEEEFEGSQQSTTESWNIASTDTLGHLKKQRDQRAVKDATNNDAKPLKHKPSPITVPSLKRVPNLPEVDRASDIESDFEDQDEAPLRHSEAERLRKQHFEHARQRLNSLATQDSSEALDVFFNRDAAYCMISLDVEAGAVYRLRTGKTPAHGRRAKLDPHETLFQANTNRTPHRYDLCQISLTSLTPMVDARHKLNQTLHEFMWEAPFIRVGRMINPQDEYEGQLFYIIRQEHGIWTCLGQTRHIVYRLTDEDLELCGTEMWPSLDANWLLEKLEQGGRGRTRRPLLQPPPLSPDEIAQYGQQQQSLDAAMPPPYEAGQSQQVRNIHVEQRPSLDVLEIPGPENWQWYYRVKEEGMFECEDGRRPLELGQYYFTDFMDFPTRKGAVWGQEFCTDKCGGLYGSKLDVTQKSLAQYEVIDDAGLGAQIVTLVMQYAIPEQPDLVARCYIFPDETFRWVWTDVFKVDEYSKTLFGINVNEMGNDFGNYAVPLMDELQEDRSSDKWEPPGFSTGADKSFLRFPGYISSTGGSTSRWKSESEILDKRASTSSERSWATSKEIDMKHPGEKHLEEKHPEEKQPELTQPELKQPELKQPELRETQKLSKSNLVMTEIKPSSPGELRETEKLSISNLVMTEIKPCPPIDCRPRGLKKKNKPAKTNKGGYQATGDDHRQEPPPTGDTNVQPINHVATKPDTSSSTRRTTRLSSPISSAFETVFMILTLIAILFSSPAWLDTDQYDNTWKRVYGGLIVGCLTGFFLSRALRLKAEHPRQPWSEMWTLVLDFSVEQIVPVTARRLSELAPRASVRHMVNILGQAVSSMSWFLSSTPEAWEIEQWPIMGRRFSDSDIYKRVKNDQWYLIIKRTKFGTVLYVSSLIYLFLTAFWARNSWLDANGIDQGVYLVRNSGVSYLEWRWWELPGMRFFVDTF